MLHLTGVKAVNSQYERLGELSVTLDDIKRFRQLDSKCPGHPEYRWTSGVETTTGPLGQGVATSVGMAIAGRWQAAHFNRPGFELFDYDVYAAVRRRRHDGGHLRRGGLAGRAPQALEPLLDLRQQQDHDRGHTDLAFSDDTATRFIGYGWNVTRVGDANDLDMLRRALPGLQEHRRTGPPSSSWTATSATARPTSRTPAPPTASRWARRRSGSPSGSTAGRRTPSSWCPTASASACATGIGRRGRELREAWLARFEDYRAAVPRPGRPARPDAAPPAARRLGPRPADLPGRPQGHGRPRRLGQGAERHRQEPALAHRRRRRPGALHQDPAHLRRRGRPRPPTTPAGATCTSASASTPWARS